MFRWIYRTFFARRATWVLEHRSGEGLMRLTVFDPDTADVVAGWQQVNGWVEGGWVLIAWPHWPHPDKE